MILAQVTEFDLTYCQDVTTTVSLENGTLKVTEAAVPLARVVLEVEVNTEEGQNILRSVEGYWNPEILAAVQSQIQLTEDEKIRVELEQKYGF